MFLLIYIEDLCFFHLISTSDSHARAATQGLNVEVLAEEVKELNYSRVIS